MLKETYFAISNRLPDDVIKVFVMRARFNSVLAPSWKLLNKAKAENWSFEKYRKHFIKEIMSNQKAIEKMREIKKLAETKDVYLICYEKDASKCHRTILIELINKLEEVK